MAPQEPDMKSLLSQEEQWQLVNAQLLQLGEGEDVDIEHLVCLTCFAVEARLKSLLTEHILSGKLDVRPDGIRLFVRKHSKEGTL